MLREQKCASSKPPRKVNGDYTGTRMRIGHSIFLTNARSEEIRETTDESLF
jgi:hypothetical protein